MRLSQRFCVVETTWQQSFNSDRSSAIHHVCKHVQLTLESSVIKILNLIAMYFAINN